MEKIRSVVFSTDASEAADSKGWKFFHTREDPWFPLLADCAAKVLRWWWVEDVVKCEVYKFGLIK